VNLDEVGGIAVKVVAIDGHSINNASGQSHRGAAWTSVR
jgi:hypothetical protein